MMKKKERTKCLIFTRVVGYLRATDMFNEGKLAEYKDRKVFTTKK